LISNVVILKNRPLDSRYLAKSKNAICKQTNNGAKDPMVVMLPSI
jgi:hypothetical protein